MLEMELKRRERENKIDSYKPYDKQLEFHTAGLGVRERLLLGGNQLGKTESGAAEASYHLTGLYPVWWQGHRFEQAQTAWIAAPTNEMIRDAVQRKLLGPIDEIGTGTIPKHLIEDWKLATGVRDLVDTVIIKHVSGGKSRVKFKTYDQGRERWQAATIDFCWFDEEPPEEIYLEGLTRTNATKGITWITFTPLLGRSSVVRRFLQEQSPFRAVTRLTIMDVKHIAPEDRQRIIDSYPAHERDARINGIPKLGEGGVFPVAREMIECEPFAIPKHWVKIGGIDIGWDHPTAAIELAWDRDADCVYVTKTYRERRKTIAIHAGAILPWGKHLPWAWPHDAFVHDKGSGDQVATQYKNYGLKMLETHAQYADKRGNSTEAGIMDILDRMQTARFKVFSNLGMWFEEMDNYHRKEGKIVKEFDDLMSATRHAMMMLRFARAAPAAHDPYARAWKKSRGAKGSAMAA